MQDYTGTPATLGLDLSDKTAEACQISEDGKIVRRGKVNLTQTALRRWLSQGTKLRVVLETGTHSPWVERVAKECGHETLVANPKRLPLISKSQKKTDANDAELLARLGRADPQLLSPIQHRGVEAQTDLEVIRARDNLVQCRTSLINHVRGAVKSTGVRLKSCSTTLFHKRALEQLPDELTIVLKPMIEQIATLTASISEYDKMVEGLCEEKYPETQLLRQVHGVGALTALTYLLVLEYPKRFARSRTVGAYLGLTPRQCDSGESKKQLGITKAGDKLLRRLLVGSAAYILGPLGKECTLRKKGERLTARGGKNAKKRAHVAVARHLAVLLHSLWKTGEVYEPMRGCST